MAKSNPINVRLTQQQLTVLRIKSIELGEPQSEVLRMLIDAGLGKEIHVIKLDTKLPPREVLSSYTTALSKLANNLAQLLKILQELRIQTASNSEINNDINNMVEQVGSLLQIVMEISLTLIEMSQAMGGIDIDQIKKNRRARVAIESRITEIWKQAEKNTSEKLNDTTKRFISDLQHVAETLRSWGF